MINQPLQKLVLMKMFDLENMDTYFKNYIPCNQHNKQPITNFCVERTCMKFLCPECVELHSYKHANHPVQSIRTCIKKTSTRINHTLSILDNEVNSHTFLKSMDTNSYQKTLIKQLHEVKNTIISQINLYFQQKELEIKRETSKGNNFKNHMDSLKKQILQAIKQLKIINKNLFVPNQSLKAIKKANLIDHAVMISHFNLQIKQLEQNLKFNVHLHMDPHKRQLLRNSLASLIGIKSLNQDKIYKSPKQQQKQIESLSQIPDYNFVINPPPLSADRYINQTALRIQISNYFQSQPFLHFFETQKSCLHVLKISDITQSSGIKWQIIPLKNNFSLPTYHRSIATENGNIFLIGGKQFETNKKSAQIYIYDAMNKCLKEVSKLLSPRSSHSILCLNKLIYITGGMNQNEDCIQMCEVFDSVTRKTKQIATCKYATSNSTLCNIGNNVIKMGGVFSSGENNYHIQIFNIVDNQWREIDPTIETTKGQFGLISCSGWATLNQSQVMIFGGYNQENNNQNSRTSFVLQSNKMQILELNNDSYVIKYINAKNLPKSGGFWNQQSIAYKNSIYCIQNVDSQNGSDDLNEQTRSLLIFNGKTWSVASQ